jgi:hypothetical protein
MQKSEVKVLRPSQVPFVINTREASPALTATAAAPAVFGVNIAGVGLDCEFSFKLPPPSGLCRPGVGAARLGWIIDAPLATVTSQSVVSQETTKCSLPLMWVPLTVENVPDTELAFRISKVVPTAGTKPLIKLRLRVPFRLAAPVAFSWSYLVPAVVPPIDISRTPLKFCVYVFETVSIPVDVDESPGVMVPLDWRAPAMDPVPNRLPPDKVTVPEADNVPSSVVLPTVCVKLPGPPVVKVLPVPIVKIPAFMKFPAVVKFRPVEMLKFPVEELVAKFLRPSVVPLWSTILEPDPINVMFAELVLMLALSNCNVPFTV